MKPILALMAALTIVGSGRAEDPQRPTWVFQKTKRVLLDVGPVGSFDETHAKYPSILKVGDKWWMWYNGRASDRFTGSVGLATSVDGLKWSKANKGQPVLRHGPPGSFDETKVDHPAVLHYGGRFHMWYTAGDKASRYKIGYATSPDGIRWTRANQARPVLGPGAKGQFDDTVVLHPAVVRDDSGLLHMWYNGVGPQGSFRVGHATSRDGIRWARQNRGRPVLEPGVVATFREGYVYNVHVRIVGGRYQMWYSAWAKGNRTTGPNHNGLTYAVSDDGNTWHKDPVPTLTNGPVGSIDQYACFACYVVERDKELWMYYSVSPANEGPYRVSLAKCRLNVRRARPK